MTSENALKAAPNNMPVRKLQQPGGAGDDCAEKTDPEHRLRAARVGFFKEDALKPRSPGEPPAAAPYSFWRGAR